ncbi:MAG: S8 family peptidase [Gaiellaceae bacterium]
MRPLRTPIAAGVLAFAACACMPGGASPAATTTATGLYSVSYRSAPALAAAVRAEHGTVARTVPALHVAEVRLPGTAAASLRRLPGIGSVEASVERSAAAAPTPAVATTLTGFEWQLQATQESAVPLPVLQAAAGVRIAVIDTGADLGAPALAQARPLAFDVTTRSGRIGDPNGHGTFVASLAAGALGSGGDAQLLVVKAGEADGAFTDVDEAAGIVYAVEHGARILNLSFAGTSTSPTERRAIRFAVHRGALVIAPVGNEFASGDPVEYPAALLQPVGSNGAGGSGLAVAASTSAGGRAPFSNTGSTVSLAAPGVDVLGALSQLSSPAHYPRAPIDSAGALYGFGSGTSFAAPQVAGAAALVWAADPALTAAQVALILKQTASGGGTWTPELGFGVIDIAAAVARSTASTGS